MALITLRVLDGADRGRTFEEVPTPFTIGREDGNAIQLNDERVCRFHLKVQEDNDRIVMTDLQSTNGTKVNGENVQLWILRPGDVLSVGRSLLLFGSREEVAQRLSHLRQGEPDDGILLEMDELEDPTESVSLEFELGYGDDPDVQATLHTLLPPELPQNLGPGQAAQLAELLYFVHLRLRGLIQSAKPKGKSDRMTLETRQWQNLLDLQDRIAGYLRAVGEPGE
ncbi:MAG: FHA domain-containing protein [Patescibacteria group bacterium]|nr:FHA domain-containing protein [Patescibacteria group bacterium]